MIKFIVKRKLINISLSKLISESKNHYKNNSIRKLA